MKNRSKLESTIRKHYFPPFNEKLIDTIETSIRLKTFKKEKLEIGESKLGGVPHLPIGTTWPIIKEQLHYSFLAQINLSQMNQYDLDNTLPEKGILYFFFNLESWDEGIVIFSTNSENLYIPEIPSELNLEKKIWFQKLFKLKGVKYVLEECSVEIFNEYHFPSWNSLQSERITKEQNLKGKNVPIFHEEVYEEGLLTEPGETELTSNHHLLGVYNGIQHEYYQLDLAGIKTKLKDLTIEEIDKALDWKLLLQLDSDNNLNLSWGDWGKIYFFIQKKDLLNRNFNNIKIVGDCY